LNYTNEQKRDYYVAGRVFLRSVLGEHTGIEPDRLIFFYSKAGKPFLDPSQNRQELYFNLTHSKELLLLAVVYRRKVGLDLEYVRPVSQSEMIAQRFFSTTGQSQIAQVTPGEKDALFMIFWVRREAYLKLNGLSLATQPTGNDNRAENTACSTDFIQTFKPAENYIAALALAGSTTPLVRGFITNLAGKSG
jgi:4'-phosphopantetheinyl transferase